MSAVEVYQIFPDGREVLIRGGNIAGLSSGTFKEIIRVGNKQEVFHAVQGGWTMSRVGSVIVPAVLLEDGEYQKIETNLPLLPVMNRP